MPSPYSSPFDALESAFRDLGNPPRPLRIDCRSICDGLPQVSVSPLELRNLLLHPSSDFATRDTMLGWIVRRAQAERGCWLVVAMGMVLPGLRVRTAALARCCWAVDEGVVDMEAEGLSGLVDTIVAVAPCRPRLAATLVWGGHGSARRFVDRLVKERNQCPVHCDRPPSLTASAHADIALYAATSAGVLNHREASLIGDTRLEGAKVVEFARAQGTPAWRVRRERRAAELRLAVWLGGRIDE